MVAAFCPVYLVSMYEHGPHINLFVYVYVYTYTCYDMFHYIKYNETFTFIFNMLFLRKIRCFFAITKDSPVFFFALKVQG